jgi:glucosamine-6-phosphate deaminase
MHVPSERRPRVVVCGSRESLGRKAANEAAQVLKSAIEQRGRARLMLAAADSQSATLAALAADASVDWARVECFHMDEYIGLPEHAPQLFGNWLRQNFFSKLPIMPMFHRISPTGAGAAEAKRYEDVMGSAPFDAVLLGLGVNGHLAFNDPPADLTDPRGARVVRLDPVSRQQQVDEGHFSSLPEVPRSAVTVTIPRLLNSFSVIGSVPGKEKRTAVAEALTVPVSGLFPGTALRTHPRVTLYLDADSSPLNLADDPPSDRRQTDRAPA